MVVSTAPTLGTGIQYAGVTISELNVVIAPKYRFEGWGNLRPWIIPIGIAFMVNSPPTNNVTYLDLGTHHAIGIEYIITPLVSIGIDARYTNGLGLTNGDVKGESWNDGEINYWTVGPYIAINF